MKSSSGFVQGEDHVHKSAVRCDEAGRQLSLNVRAPQELSQNQVSPTKPPSTAQACHWAGGLPTEVLRWGSTGNCVAYLQGRLAVTADVIFGRETHHAVILTQDHCGIRADGIVGPRTWDALLHWCRE